MKNLFPLAALVAGLSVATVSAQTLSQWTFEDTVPNSTPGAGVWYTNLSAEAGIAPGVASGFHAGNATYSNPAGNGSAESFSVNTWAQGDLFQFVLATTGFQNIGVSFDHVSSGTGPRDFSLTYSTDGEIFVEAGSYQVLANAAPNPVWSSGTYQSLYTFNFDLSGIPAVEDASTLYIRLVNSSTVSAAGGTVAATGTSRVDNFTVAVVPEPAGMLALGGLLLLAGRKFLFRRS
jgi:hypothetical protein